MQYTERQRHKALRLSAAASALSRLKLSRLLPAWLQVTAQQQQHAELKQQAQHHHERQMLLRVLSDWQDHAAEAAVERLQLTAAAELHRLRLLGAGLQGLSWYHR